MTEHRSVSVVEHENLRPLTAKETSFLLGHLYEHNPLFRTINVFSDEQIKNDFVVLSRAHHYAIVSGELIVK